MNDLELATKILKHTKDLKCLIKKPPFEDKSIRFEDNIIEGTEKEDLADESSYLIIDSL